MVDQQLKESQEREEEMKTHIDKMESQLQRVRLHSSLHTMYNNNTHVYTHTFSLDTGSFLPTLFYCVVYSNKVRLSPMRTP